MLPMDADLYESLNVPTDPEEQRRIHTDLLRRWLRLVPEAADEAVERGRRDGVEKGLQPLQHQFERRLSRQLSPSEQSILRQRLGTLGAVRRASRGPTMTLPLR